MLWKEKMCGLALNPSVPPLQCAGEEEGWTEPLLIKEERLKDNMGNSDQQGELKNREESKCSGLTSVNTLKNTYIQIHWMLCFVNTIHRYLNTGVPGSVDPYFFHIKAQWQHLT